MKNLEKKRKLPLNEFSKLFFSSAFIITKNSSNFL